MPVEYRPWTWKVPENSKGMKQDLTRQDAFERVKLLQQNPMAAKVMSDAALLYAQEHLSFVRIVDELHAVYESTLYEGTSDATV